MEKLVKENKTVYTFPAVCWVESFREFTEDGDLRSHPRRAEGGRGRLKKKKRLMHFHIIFNFLMGKHYFCNGIKMV